MKYIFIFVLTLGLVFLGLVETRAQPCATTPISYSMVAQPGGTVEVYVTSSVSFSLPGIASPSSIIVLKFPTGAGLTSGAVASAAINFSSTIWGVAKADAAPSCSPGFDYVVVSPNSTYVPNFSPGVPQLAFTFTPPVAPPCLGAIELMTNTDPYATASGCGTGVVSTRANQYSMFSTGFLSCNAYGGNTGGPVSCDPNVALPVELLSFNATKLDFGSLLNWETASELNNEGFNVQRSFDGSNWETLGWVDGNGTTQRQMSYEFTDSQPRNGDNYYRLEQRDFDGKTAYSEIRHLIFGSGPESLTIFPNPTEGVFILDMPGYSNGEVLLRATDATGRVVFEQHNLDFSNTRQELDFSHLAPGMYQLNVSYPLGNETVQLVIARD